MKFAFIFGACLLTAVAHAQVKETEKRFGQENAVYFGGDFGWSYSDQNIGSGFAYGADGAYLQRFDGSFGSAYAGAGAYSIGSSGSSGSINSFGGQFLLHYQNAMLAALLGAASLRNVNGVDASYDFAWGGRLTFDYPVFGDKFTLGPGGSALVLTPGGKTYINYAAFLAVKAWW